MPKKLDTTVKRYKKAKFFSIDFTQTNFFSDLDETIKANGNIEFNNTTTTITYEAPQKQQIIITRDMIYIKNLDTNEVTEQQTEEGSNIFLPHKIIENYQSKIASVETYEDKFILTLQRNTDTIKSIEISISNKNEILEIMYLDDEKNKVTYHFSNTVIN